MSFTPSPLVDRIVRAGAGAGKTTTLTKQVVETALSFFHEHGRFPRMVVTTFTRKATQELRERLVVAAVKSDNVEFLEYVSSRSSLHISTIHGVLSLFLRRYGHLLQVDSGFKILSETEAFHVAKGVFRQQLFENSEFAELLETHSVSTLVNMLRRHYACRLESPAARVLAETDQVPLFHRLVDPWVERLEATIAEAQAQTQVESWKDYFLRLQQLLRIVKGLESKEDWSQLERARGELGRKPTFSTKKQGEAFSSVLKSRLDEDWDSLNELLGKRGVEPSDWEEVERFCRRFDQAARDFFERFSRKKVESGQLEMGDLELIARDRLRKFPQIGASFSAEWDYWLIDEFQDTSPIQVELLDILIGDRKAFLVGDPQQSIYLFRGARSEVFQERWAAVKARGGVADEKVINYRSQPPLLLFLNDLFSSLSHQFRPMEPHGVPTGDRVVATFAVAPHYGPEANQPGLSEVEAIIEHIEKLRAQGAGFQDICILGRTNAQLSDLASRLLQIGYPVYLHAASGYFDRREIRDAVALLRFLLNPADDQNLLVLLRSPFFRVEDRELASLRSQKGEPLWTRLQAEPRPPSVGRLEKYRELSQERGVAWAVRRALLDEGFFDVSLKYDGTGRREANLWKFLQQLEDQQRTPGARFIDLADQVTEELNTNEESAESDAVTALVPNRINLMTIHSAKGLQFTHVILPRCDRGPRGRGPGAFGVEENQGVWGVTHSSSMDGESIPSLPQLVALAERRGREQKETERLLYVALTRAKESLLVSWSGTPQAGSWADQLGSWTGKVGRQQTPAYCYDVEAGPWLVKPRVDNLDSAVAISTPVKATELKVTGLGRKFSVSEYLEEKLQLPQMEQMRPGAELVQVRVQASNEGILIHRLMETLHYNWDFDFRQVLDRWFGSQASRAETALNFVKSAATPPLPDLIRRGFVEWGFQVPTVKGILEGQIDLWGEAADGTTWLVDYKSGSERYLQKALHQLSLYSLALRRLGISGEINLAVVYPLLGKSHVQVAPSESELHQLFPELFSGSSKQ
ncbi:MAG: UvrD-helicase domain-containing protein [Bdellovibrionales bacterium]|nr:UvrD-helicase domain-containing protein [Bdellovibrionales bacterium]